MRHRSASIFLFLALSGCVTLKQPAKDILGTLTSPRTSHRAVIPESRENEPKWNDYRKRIIREAKGGDIGLLFLGDSLTQGWRSHPELFERYFGKYKPLNAGIWSDGTQHLLWRLKNDSLGNINPRVTVILIGANNGYSTPQQVAEGVAMNIKEVMSLFPKTKIILLGLFPALQSPKARIRQKHKDVNRLLRHLGRLAHVTYLDFGNVFLEKDKSISKSIMFDYMHLTKTGFMRWGDAMRPTLERLWEQASDT